MQKEDAIKQLAKLQEEVDKLKAIIDTPPTNQLDLLPSGWYMYGTGGITSEAGYSLGSRVGDAFASKQQAKHFAEYYKIWCLVNSRCVLAAEGFNCGGGGQYYRYSLKHSVSYNHEAKKFVTYSSTSVDFFGVQLPNRETAQEVADWLNNHVQLKQDGWYLDGESL